MNICEFCELCELRELCELCELCEYMSSWSSHLSKAPKNGGPTAQVVTELNKSLQKNTFQKTVSEIEVKQGNIDFQSET